MNKLEQFFYDHAGYSFDPKTETAEDGRKRNAWCLATAYIEAIAGGYYFLWGEDDEEPSKLQCTMHNGLIKDSGDNPVQGLFEIDVSHVGDPYCRVVEAELALQELG